MLLLLLKSFLVRLCFYLTLTVGKLGQFLHLLLRHLDVLHLQLLQEVFDEYFP